VSRHFGTLFQVGYVVRDLDAALEHWVEVLGIGPFFLVPMPIVFSYLNIDDKPAGDTNLIARNALAYSGDTQIELIVPGTAASTYHEFLDAGCRGVHHLGFESPNLEAQLARAIGAGDKVVLQGELPGFKFAYLEPKSEFDGPTIELVEMSPDAKAMFAKIKAGSIGWDGRNPVRKLT
jgi:hypothetical protein